MSGDSACRLHRLCMADSPTGTPRILKRHSWPPSCHTLERVESQARRGPARYMVAPTPPESCGTANPPPSQSLVVAKGAPGSAARIGHGAELVARHDVPRRRAGFDGTDLPSVGLPVQRSASSSLQRNRMRVLRPSEARCTDDRMDTSHAG